MPKQAKFYVGQLIEHELFDYRGVIIDVDPYFMLTDEWYQLMAKSRPPKDHPWYRVLVHNSNHETYVAEQNLRADKDGDQINHPDLRLYFSKFDHGRYLLNETKSN
ncbi:MAG: heat shock protein HspQ [Pseudomonadales bacterium]|nr:heat shock protein HspQ [Pseudomonadales bacterium]